MTHWHVCRAPADWHRLIRALDEARRVGVEVYAPMVTIETRKRMPNGRHVRLERIAPAYPGWAFAPAPPSVPGIRALVYADGSPVLIRAAAIERVRRWEAEEAEAHLLAAAVEPVAAPRLAERLGLPALTAVPLLPDLEQLGAVRMPDAAPMPTTCQWLDGEARERRFCGAPAVRGRPWCATHMARVFARGGDAEEIAA